MSYIPDFDSLFTLSDKTAIVTGGSRGIGLHAATGLLLAGVSTLIITSRKADACDAAVKSLYSVLPKGRDAKILAIPSDLSKPQEVKRFVEEVKKVTDKVHILIANAGATWGEKLETFVLSQILRCWKLTNGIDTRMRSSQRLWI